MRKDNFNEVAIDVEQVKLNQIVIVDAKTKVKCIEDDYTTDRFGCNACYFDDKQLHACLTPVFDYRFECRGYKREDKKDVHFEKVD